MSSMYLRKSLKTCHLLVCRQRCVNWCQLVVNRRQLSDDNNDDKHKDLDMKYDNRVDTVSKRGEEEMADPKDRVLVAKHNLNQLIDTLKSKEIFGKSDDKLTEVLAKPVFHIKQSRRKEVPIDDNMNENINEISGQIDKRLVMAAKGIARSLSGEEAKKTENDLLKLLKLQIIETNYAKSGQIMPKDKLASLLGDMKVLKEEPREQFFTPIVPMSEQRSYQTRGEFESRDSGQEFRQKRRPFDRRESFGDFDGQSVSQSMLERRPPRQQSMFAGREQHNLFAGESIGIFEADMKEATDAPKLQIWDRLMNDELQESIAQTPRNMFEEMIQWTEEGKLWRFPINNEQGLEAEESVPFYEHVLLDHLLDGFPESGPIRKFMELVIMGLSSNPYITVERKHATVQYYKQYFEERHELLETAGVLANS